MPKGKGTGIIKSTAKTTPYPTSSVVRKRNEKPVLTKGGSVVRKRNEKY